MPPPPRPLRLTRRCTTGLRRMALRPLRPLTRPPMLLPIRSLSRSAISAQATTTSRSPALARMQLDQNGDANSWSLGEFLAQDEVRVMMLDPACTKSLTFREFVNGRLRSRTPTTGLVHQPRRAMAPSTTSLHRRTPSPPPALGHPSRPPTGCRSSHPNLSALGTEPTEPSRTPAASRAAPRSPAETGSARV